MTGLIRLRPATPRHHAFRRGLFGSVARTPESATPRWARILTVALIIHAAVMTWAAVTA